MIALLAWVIQLSLTSSHGTDEVRMNRNDSGKSDFDSDINESSILFVLFIVYFNKLVSFSYLIINNILKELEVFLDKASVSFQVKTKENNRATAIKPEHLQCIKQAIESLCDYKKGSFNSLYFDEGRYCGRLINVHYESPCLY